MTSDGKKRVVKLKARATGYSSEEVDIEKYLERLKKEDPKLFKRIERHFKRRSP